MTEKTIGDRLRTIRKTLNLNQESVAQLLHITIQTLSRYEKNSRLPDCLFLEQFGRAYLVNANWLLYGTGDIFLEDPGVFEIMQNREKKLQYLFKKVEEIFNELNK